MLVWNPLGPNGLWSQPSEIHATLVAFVAAVVVIVLHRRGYPRVSMLALFVSLLAALSLSAEGIDWKSWYFGTPLALIAGTYFIFSKRKGVRSLVSRMPEIPIRILK